MTFHLMNNLNRTCFIFIHRPLYIYNSVSIHTSFSLCLYLFLYPSIKYFNLSKIFFCMFVLMECNYPRLLSLFNDLKLFIYPHIHTHIQTQRESCLEVFNLAAAPGCWRWEKGDYNWKNSSASVATSKLRTARSKGKRTTRDVSGRSMTSEHSTWSGGGGSRRL